LGIQPTGEGFSTVDIRPDLVDLAWAKGAEPTPRGLLKVDARKDGSGTAIAIDVPEGVVARVSVPVSASAGVTLNGSAAKSVAAENGARAVVTLDHAGHYQLATR
jgi:hypothetical protein